MPPTLSASKVPSRQERQQMLKQQLIENKSIISAIQKTAAQNPEVQSLDLQFRTCSPDQPYPTEYYVSPNYEEPEARMTVKEAKCASDSDSD